MRTVRVSIRVTCGMIEQAAAALETANSMSHTNGGSAAIIGPAWTARAPACCSIGSVTSGCRQLAV
jgi:hypothetical protein